MGFFTNLKCAINELVRSATLQNEVTAIILHKLKKIEMTNADLLALLKADEAKLDTLISDVQALVAKIGTVPDVPQEIVDEANALGAKLDTAITTATP